MTTKKRFPERTIPGHRPRSFEAQAPFMLDDIGYTLAEIRRARAAVDAVEFGDRHTPSGSALRIA